MNKSINKNKRSQGFTIVELLIVIVVIAILAAITVVAYSGIQERARDSQRASDIKTISKALEMYYLDNQSYPGSNCGSACPSPKKINPSWATTSDGSWKVLEDALVPKYISKLPADPKASLTTAAAISGDYNYDYVTTSGWCNASSYGQVYMLAYRYESKPQTRDIVGDCSSGDQPNDYSSSEYVTVKK